MHCYDECRYAKCHYAECRGAIFYATKSLEVKVRSVLAVSLSRSVTLTGIDKHTCLLHYEIN
jgi:hypothetical protein